VVRPENLRHIRTSKTCELLRRSPSTPRATTARPRKLFAGTRPSSTTSGTAAPSSMAWFESRLTNCKSWSAKKVSTSSTMSMKSQLQGREKNSKQKISSAIDKIRQLFVLLKPLNVITGQCYQLLNVITLHSFHLPKLISCCYYFINVIIIGLARSEPH